MTVLVVECPWFCLWVLEVSTSRNEDLAFKKNIFSVKYSRELLTETYAGASQLFSGWIGYKSGRKWHFNHVFKLLSQDLVPISSHLSGLNSYSHRFCCCTPFSTPALVLNGVMDQIHY